MISITYLGWRYVEAYDFYDVMYQLDGYVNKKVYINSHRLEGLDMPIPEAVAFLLRAKLDCDPIRRPEKQIDKR